MIATIQVTKVINNKEKTFLVSVANTHLAIWHHPTEEFYSNVREKQVAQVLNVISSQNKKPDIQLVGGWNFPLLC